MKETLVKIIKSKYIKLLIQLLLYSAVLFFIYRTLSGNIAELKDAGEISYSWLIFAALFFSSFSLFNALNWNYIVSSSGEETKVVEQMEVYLKSMILRYIPGNVVGIMSRAVYNKAYGIRMIKTLWAWFVENITFLVVGMILGTYVLLKIKVSTVFSFPFVITASVIGLLAILKLDWWEIIFMKYIAPLFKKRLGDTNAKLNLPLKSRIIIFFRYLISWIIYSATFIMVVRSVTSISFSDIFTLSAICAIAWAIGYLSFITPSGTGVREAIIILALTTIYSNDRLSSGDGLVLSHVDSVIIALGARVVTVVGDFISVGLFYLFKLLKRK